MVEYHTTRKAVKVNGKLKEIVTTIGWSLIPYHGKYFLTLRSQVGSTCKRCGKYQYDETVYRSKLEWNQNYCKDCVEIQELKYSNQELQEAIEETILNKSW